MALSYPDTNALTERIIGCAIEVHRYYGPGLLESVYEEGFIFELSNAGIEAEQQRQIPIFYKSHRTDSVFRADLIVDRKVVVEIKHVDKLLPVHESQVLTYLRMTGLHVGLLFNFNNIVLMNGFRRISK